MNWELLDQLIEDKYIKVKKHPTAELYIYNYTAKVQYERMWNEWTLACRGLIMDNNRQIVARPFPKFFNLGEHENQVIPNESFEVYDKLDGSLGLLYWIDSEAFIATRGSFISEQAQKATHLLNTTYKHALAKLDRAKTYLFEIIYPENRIVVDYGNREELILLGVIDTASGQELDLEEIGFPTVQQFDGVKDLHALKGMEEENREGFVVRFKNGLRIKVKFDEYQRIHRIVTNVSSIDLWDSIRQNLPLDEVLERVPDEFYGWVRKMEKRLKLQYIEIEETARREIKTFPSMKETAAYVFTCQYPHVMFAMIRGKDYRQLIWRMIRPQHEKPFSAAFQQQDK